MALKSGANVLAISPFPNLFEGRTSPNEGERLKLQQLMRDYVNSYQQQRLGDLKGTATTTSSSSSSNQRASAALRQARPAAIHSTSLQWWQRQKEQQLPMLQLLELPHQQFDFWQMSEPQRKLYQDDLLHLTPRGYDILGHLVATTIYKSTPGGVKGLCGC